MTSVNIYPTQKDTVIHELTVDNDFRITKKITIRWMMVILFASQETNAATDGLIIFAL